MDIIAVTHSRLKASLDEAIFDLNSAMGQPMEDGSKEKFAKALHKYTHTNLQLEALFKLQKQVDQANKPRETTNKEEKK